jgi:Zn-dependent protease with chaperone function
MPMAPDATPTEEDRRRADRAKGHEDQLLAQALSERGHPVRNDSSSWMAVGLAVLVHLVTVFLLALGVGLLVEAGQVPIIAALAVGCLAMAYALRPRLGRVPRRAVVLTRQSHPVTFQLLDFIAGRVESPGFDLIVLDRGSNAATGQVGLKRRRVLYLGAALWSGLEWDERCAVLAHEFGHNVNNDVRRKYLLATSIGALTVWINTLSPKTKVQHFPRALFTTLVRNPLRKLATRALQAQLRLSSGVSRLAEYRADDISASVAGTDAAVRALDKALIIGSSMDLLVRTASYAPEADLWAGEKRYIDSFPPRQRRRLRHIDQLSPPDMYATHPNTWRRISYLLSDPVVPSVTTMAPAPIVGVEEELTPQLRKLAKEMHSQVRRRPPPAPLRAPQQS